MPRVVVSVIAGHFWVLWPRFNLLELVFAGRSCGRAAKGEYRGPELGTGYAIEDGRAGHVGRLSAAVSAGSKGDWSR